VEQFSSRARALVVAGVLCALLTAPAAAQVEDVERGRAEADVEAPQPFVENADEDTRRGGADDVDDQVGNEGGEDADVGGSESSRGQDRRPEDEPDEEEPAESSARQPPAPAAIPPAAPAPRERTANRPRNRPRPAGEQPQRRPKRAAAPGPLAGDRPTIGAGASPRPRRESSGGPNADGVGSVDERPDDEGGSVVTRTVEDIVEVVPDSVRTALLGLVGLSLVLAGASLLGAVRARSLARQRQELLHEVGLLQTALLPPVPERLGALRTSVAYRPADGPGAGGDFYDALELAGGRVAFILGDVSGHGRTALERTAFLRYTLRAYLEAGLEPRVALQVAGRVVDEQLRGDFATVVLALHDPTTASLSFACAGHPAPIVTGPSSYQPILASGSPPLGIGLRTGLRQTTLPLAPGSMACLFTDGVTEARTERGILGRPRLGDILDEIGRDADASEVIDRVASEARVLSDDMAVCLLAPTAGVTAGGFRSEQLEVSAEELRGNLARRFLEAAGVTGQEAARAELEAADLAQRFGGAVLDIGYGNRDTRVQVLPRNVESIEAASRRALLG
jgi:hypothetical protein